MNIGILGATGAVGVQMLECLKERKIPVDTLKLFASKKSAGSKVKFLDKEIVVEEANENSFDGLDCVLGAVENKFAKEFAPAIKKAGAVFIDNSSAFRMVDDIPLVVPEINAEDIKKHNGIIANPNCSTIITCMAVYGIHKIAKIKTMIASTYQAVSGAGVYGIKSLEEELTAIVNNEEMPETSVFPYQIAYNCIPSIGSPSNDGYTTEELKLQNEGRKIMHIPDMKVTCTCIRVPVLRSHSISVSLGLEKNISVEEARTAVKNMPNVILDDDLDNKIFPMPINTTNKDIVSVGRIRKDYVLENGIALWCSGDQIRKGAATNAVEILQNL